MTVIAEVASIEDARAEAEKLKPDLVILALRLEGRLAGIELCRDIKNLPAAPQVLVYTSFNSTADVSATYLAGADGFVYKGAGTRRLLRCVREVSAGARIFITGAESEDHDLALQKVLATSQLTPKEREVLGLMLQRFSNSQIAEELVVELSTVKTHVRRILRKLDLGNRRELF